MSVTVMVTSHEITEKNIEGSGKMMSYNVCKTHIDLKENTWLFRVG